MSRKSIRVFLAAAAIACAAGALYAAPNREAPDAEITTSETQYISPKGTGTRTAATVDFEVTVYVKSREGYVPEYGIRITDAAGNVLRQVVQQEKSDIGWFVSLFRGFQAFTLKRSLTWDGTDPNGNTVPDGEYQVGMWVVAGSNQRSDYTVATFVVDTTLPSVTVVEPDPKIFSPNGDGRLDTLTIRKSGGTVEDLWVGTFSNAAGAVVRTYRWQSAAPETIVWDGKTDAGVLAPDGVYSYRLTSTDRAGNPFNRAITNIELSTVATPIRIARDIEYISPNGDGVQDTVTFTLSQDVQKDIVEWNLVVADGAGAAVRQYSGAGAPPPAVVFDGKNDAGQVVREGSYRGIYSLVYRHGNNPSASAPFVVDLTKPTITVTVVDPIFSPNGDGRKDVVQISFRSSEPVSWTGSVRDARGAAVLSTSYLQTTSLIVWDGRNMAGALAPEGRYTVDAVFTDRAGNSVTPQIPEIVLDITPPRVTFNLNKDYFSPDGDGIKDTVTAAFTSSEPVQGLITITDRAGREQGTFGGFGQAYQYFDGTFEYVWDGITGSGLYIVDGTYTLSSVYEDRAGNRTTLQPLSLTVDTRPVSVAVSTVKGFSPNNDGRFDTLPVTIRSSFYDNVERWRMSYVDASMKVMQVQEGTETLPRELVWDGSMQYERTVKAPEGRYTAKLDVTFRKGNVVQASTQPFFIDVTPPAVSLQATADPFIKVDSKMEGDLFITMRIQDAHQVADWSLDLLSPAKDIVRSFTGRGDIKDAVVWQEQRESVRSLPIGEQMTLRVEVVDEVGNATVYERRVPVDLIVVRKDGKLYLMVPNVIFGAYQHALDSRGPEWLASNMDSIRRVFAIFQRYPNRNLMLEGHALNIYRDGPREAAEEAILVPLTERRAETVRNALTALGMNAVRIRTEWFGGTQPIVDVTDTEIHWKNRRVEFIMLE